MKKNKLIAMTMALAVVCMAAGCGNTANNTTDETETASVESTSAVNTETTAEAAEEFPLKIDNERLSLDSVFQFSGTNPDKDFEEQENICSIQLTNVSGKYLEKAEITIISGEGEEYHFTVEDLPDGMTVYAFDTDNKQCELEESVKDNSVDSKYDKKGTGILDSDVTATAESSSVTLHNTGSDSYDTVVVRYHDSMDGVLFGGISYETSVSNLVSGSNAEFTADEVMLGDAIVTSVKEK